MGVFDRVLAEHKARQQAEADAAVKARDEAAATAKAFAIAFWEKVEQVAKPALQAFAAEGIEKGFQAVVEDGESTQGLPYVEVRFTSHPQKVLGAGGRTHVCVYRLGVTHERKVAHIREADASMPPFSETSGGLESISPQVIERELAELLARALKTSRA